jgi:hypothetical protein
MMVACCPNIDLFRSYRNAMVRSLGDSALAAACPPNAPLQDWYGTLERVTLLDHLLDKAHLDLPFDETEWPSFLESSIRRGKLETADLTANYDRMKGATYRHLFENLLRIIADTRQCADRKWVGLHETWMLDFYPLLARSFPEARFLLMFRDPRAIVNSMLGVEAIDPSQVGQILSYVRHWRKYAALALKFANDPLLKGRLHITSHDLVLTRTEETLTGICSAFDLELDRRMLDSNNFFNYATGTIWLGNSSFEAKTEGFGAHRAFRWRERLQSRVIALIEYLCGPEMALVGYPTVTKYADPQTDADADIFEALIADLTGYANWRSDLGDPLLDLGLEAVRRQLLRARHAVPDPMLVRKTFLFEEAYDAIHNRRGPLLPQLAQALKD